MKNKDIEERIYHEFNEQKPELFQQILKQCPKMQKQDEKVSIWNKVQNVLTAKAFRYTLVPLTAVFVMIFIFFGLVTPTQEAYSVIALDVNPSLVLELDEGDKVINVITENTDAEIIIGTMDLNGVDSDVAIYAIIGSMVANGYISDISNSILLSIQSDDPSKEEEMLASLTQVINDLLDGSSINGSVISQTLNFNQDAEDLAEALNISEAKAELIIRVIEKDPRMNANELALLSINDINLLLSSKNYVIDTVKQTGTASELEYIAASEAFQIALTAFGLDEAYIVEYDIELEQEDGIMVYEIDMETITFEYTIVINAKLGTVLHSEQEDTTDPDDDDTNDPIQDNLLTEEQILDIVVAELSLIKANIMNPEFDLEFESNIAFYDLSFEYGVAEYELEINAETGVIYSNSMDEEGYDYEDTEDEVDEEEIED